jgi:hypothetical protein
MEPSTPARPASSHRLILPRVGEDASGLAITILIPDPAVGSREALRRLLGLLDGTMQAGPANEAFVGVIAFRPFEHSAAQPQLAQLLAGVNWRVVFRRLCRFRLRPINARPCRRCGGVDRYRVRGRVKGIACAGCGNIVPLSHRGEEALR